jgi:hypothetical protein
MPMSADDVRRRIAEAVHPSHFFVGPATRLEWDHRDAEEVSWEVFRGRLLDPAHTRQRHTFESWNVYLLGDECRSPEPLLSVKWDAAAGEAHVVRAVLAYVQEAYDAGGNVILTREVRKWVRELVGTLPVPLPHPGRVTDPLAELLFRAVVGTSRLPLTSLEAPLPAFSLGELGYFPASYRPGAGAMTSSRELTEHGLVAEINWLGRVKLLELLLRSAPAREVRALTRQFIDRDDRVRQYQWAPDLLRSLFNEVSLSPYTDFVSKALLFVEALEAERCLDAAGAADFLGHLLRQAGRHLTAYDLVLFHHRGANYPDALLLDAVLREYLSLIERRPALFLAEPGDERERRLQRLRRRALRQAWLVRQRYRGHAVPDAPTSPGENARVLPDPHVRVPEEQILNPHRRTRQLFLDDPPGGELGADARAVLRQSVRDLDHPDELRELGMALYLDRPLGAFKAPGEPDQTPLLSYTAFSRSLAMRRLLLLGQDRALLPDDELASLRQALEALPVSGVPLAEVPSVPRPGVVSLADAARAAEDFVFLRTTASSLRDFFALFDFGPLAERCGTPDLTSRPWLVLGRPDPAAGEITLTIHEPGSPRKRLELSADPRDGYVVRGGVEYPRKGLRVRRVWQEIDGELRECDLGGEELFVRPV